MNIAPQIEKAISDGDQLIIGQTQELSDKLKQHRLEMFPPRALKGLREFQLAEVARFLGVTSGYLCANSCKCLVLNTLKGVDGNMNLDWLRYLVTRYDPQAGP